MVRKREDCAEYIPALARAVGCPAPPATASTPLCTMC